MQHADRSIGRLSRGLLGVGVAAAMAVVGCGQPHGKVPAFSPAVAGVAVPVQRPELGVTLGSNGAGTDLRLPVVKGLTIGGLASADMDGHGGAGLVQVQARVRDDGLDETLWWLGAAVGGGGGEGYHSGPSASAFVRLGVALQHKQRFAFLDLRVEQVLLSDWVSPPARLGLILGSDIGGRRWRLRPYVGGTLYSGTALTHPPCDCIWDQLSTARPQRVQRTEVQISTGVSIRVRLGSIDEPDEEPP